MGATDDLAGRIRRVRVRLDGLGSGEDVAADALLCELQLAVEELQRAQDDLQVHRAHIMTPPVLEAQRLTSTAQSSRAQTSRAQWEAPLYGTREVRMVELVAQLSTALVEDFDVIDVLTQVCEGLCDTMDIDACGVLLANGDRIEIAAVSGPDVKEVEFAQLQVGDGPCLDALRGNKPVVVDSPEAMRESWPTFADACARVDLVSVAAFPLPGPNGPLGTLNAFRRMRAGFAPQDLATCQAMARVIVLAITNAWAFEDSRRQAEHLRHALASRVVIEQAKGIVARDLRVDMATAFHLLRSTARQRRAKLHALASDVVAGSVEPADLAAP